MSINSVHPISPRDPERQHSICPSSAENNNNKGTLSRITSKEVHHTSHERITTPIDLTAAELRNIGVETSLAKLQRGVVRLRVELNGESVCSGSGIVISSDGLILSVNHVPALGSRRGEKPLDFVAGADVLKNMKTWSELLGQKGEVKLVADFPLLPNPLPPQTIFTPPSDKGGLTIHSDVKSFFGRSEPACQVPQI